MENAALEMMTEREAIQVEPNLPSQSFDPARYGIEGTLMLGTNEYRWSVWDGQPLGKYIAMDTETTLADKHEVPQLAMVSVSDGSQHYLLKPEQLPELLLQHLPNDHHLVFHHVAFDFAVIDRHLTETDASIARNWMWAAVDQHRMHDTMLLAALVTLAQHDDDRMPSLHDAVKDWCGYELEKDAFRLRFEETIGEDWHSINSGFLRYAAADAIATFQLFAKLTHAANRICRQFNLPRQFGFLTEAVQVKAAVSLDCIHRNGLHVDLDRATELKQRIDADIQQAIETMDRIDAELWHRYKKTRELKINRNSGLPRLNQTKLLEHFATIAAECQLSIPTTRTGKLSTSVNHCWCQFRDRHPLIDAYCRYTELTKLRAFFDGLQQPQIHPKYRVMVRSGRTSCSGPNIQQLPSNSPVREAIAARPGHLLFIIDYNSLELRTLATVCHQQIGFSRLRDVLIEGIDPHSYAAAMFAGVTLEEFNALPDKKQLRQRAKVFNFGLPAGFGAAALVEHAKFSYGVDLTPSDAERFIKLLTRKVYPELGLYLAEDTAAIIAKALQADVVQVRATWPQPFHLGMLRKILADNPRKSDGTPYQQRTIERVWRQLAGLCGNLAITPHIEQRNTAPDSPLRKLLHSSVTTTTGRMRGGVPFTAAKNTPFQGLAADGCKQAMWDLTKTGYRVVAFIHDEFIIELSKHDDIDRAAKDIARICSESMQPFVPGIPVPCEYALTERWHKSAEAVFDTADRLQVWQPN
ncbi:DNA polymerase I, thermostable [Stieleria maiorica]|uniref:DNA polymerase I n=1 Tax=Stieleria maiorica TaxID=2795974 RepID=A0A5B9MC63_9BACT|nr:DNA polymerase [Stieleria maiorica]QEF98802.1 DNA polymerase I, thermostable [Stieleria maiorica]